MHSERKESKLITFNSVSEKPLSELINLIDSNKIALPELQRPSVWEKSKIPLLISSIYSGYPLGVLLVWAPGSISDEHKIRCRPFAFQDEDLFDSGKDIIPEYYLIDGQQRLTSLYKSLHPNSYDENGMSKNDVNIAFNVNTQEFRLIDALLKQKVEKNQDQWYRISTLLKSISTYTGLMSTVESVCKDNSLLNKDDVFNRLRTLSESLDINRIKLPIYLIGNKSYYEVTEIFERINLGTPVKLSQILLGKLSAKHPGIVSKVEDSIKILRCSKYYDRSFDLDTFMSMTTLIATDYIDMDRLEDRFIKHKSIDTDDISSIVLKTDEIFKSIADFCKKHFFIDQMKFFRAERTILALGYFLHKRKIENDTRLENQLAHWVYLAALSNQHNDQNRLRRDISIIRDIGNKNPYQDLMKNLSGNDGHLNWILKYNGLKLKSKPQDEICDGDIQHSQGNHIFGCMYGLIRKNNALSFVDELNIGVETQMEIHHIYPKSLVIKLDDEISKWHSDIANLTFISKSANRKLSDTDVGYLQGQKESIRDAHFIPRTKQSACTDKSYKRFITERRSLIHQALKDMITDLEKKAND